MYDMSGNVWQWVADWYDENYGVPADQLKTIVTDPMGAKAGSRVLRGGSWGNLARFLRSGGRYYYSPGDRYNFFGFRLVRIPAS
jgi:sulfatase modifying factor 1